jgi:uncharacterized protein (DUF1330 family)
MTKSTFHHDRFKPITGAFLATLLWASIVSPTQAEPQSATPASPTRSGPMTFVELHWLKNGGADTTQAVDYVTWVKPIAKRHRARILDISPVSATMKGTIAPAFVWMYEFRDAEAMAQMMQDATYVANLPTRSAIWDFDKNDLFAVTRLLKNEGSLAPRSGWVNFVELHWARDAKAAEEYVRWIQPLAKKHGGEVAQVFKVDGVLHGDLQPQYIWVYRFRGQQAMGSLMSDPEYVKNVPNRDRIWDFEKNQLLVVQPRNAGK